jgi:Lrp/AsnC family leucine-responsive transcriptional regulator
MELKLDGIDKRILFELERNARIPDVKLAKIVKKSKDTVRYRVKNLEDNKIITGYKTWIDFAKLGYASTTIYFNLLNIPEKRSKLIDYIKNDKRTYWIGVAEGAWNIGVSYFIKNNEELFAIKHELMSKFREIIIDVKITSLVSVSVHEKNFLINENTTLTTFSENVTEYDLDDVSKKILGILYWNAKENIAAIADQLNSTIDIIRNRIQNMQKEGLIIRYSAVIDYHQIGYEFYKAFVYLKKFDKEIMKKLNDYVKDSKVIINMVRQIASWDIELILFATSFSEYDKTIGEFNKEFSQNVQKVETATMSEDIIFPCKKLVIL